MKLSRRSLLQSVAAGVMLVAADLSGVPPLPRAKTLAQVIAERARLIRGDPEEFDRRRRMDRFVVRFETSCGESILADAPAKPGLYDQRPELREYAFDGMARALERCAAEREATIYV